MSAPPPAGGIHLLVADDALPEGHPSGIYLTICGAVLHASNLPSSCCPEGCDCDLALYCPDCVSQAAEWAAPAGSQPDPSVRAAQQHDSRLRTWV